MSYRYSKNSIFTGLALLCVALGSAGCSDAGEPEAKPTAKPAAYEPVDAYLAALNAHSFANADAFASEEWNFISPVGAWSRDREESIALLTELEAGVLRDATFELVQAAVHYTTSDIAIVTTTTVAKNTPADLARERATFVVVRRDDQWLLLVTEVTTISLGPEHLSGGTFTEGPLPHALGGDVESETTRAELARRPVDWFHDLPVSHDFDSATDLATEEWSFVGPVGSWTTNRDDTVAMLSVAFTTFLDGAVTTDQDVVASFPTDDVVLFVGTGGTVLDDELSIGLSTSVVVNREGHWLLDHTHLTAVQ